MFDLGPMGIVASVAGRTHCKQHLILDGFDRGVLGIERVHMRGMQVHDVMGFPVLIELEGPICLAAQDTMPAVAFLAQPSRAVLLAEPFGIAFLVRFHASSHAHACPCAFLACLHCRRFA